VLLDVVEALRGDYRVMVALPAEGPLASELAARDILFVVLEDYVMRKRNLRPRQVLAWIGRVARSTRRLFRLQREQPFAVVYSNTLAVPVGPLLKLRFGLPHIWHAHEVLEGATWFRRSIGWALRFGADTVVCVSKSVEDQLWSIERALRRKSVVIYNAVDVPALPQPSHSARPLVTLGCVGRLYPRKGHLLLLQALRRARDAGADCELLVFGDPLPNTTFLDEVRAEIHALGLAGAVTLRGFEPCIERIYSEFDVLVLASTEPEAFPLACLEAQAWGLPVIAPNEGGPTEMVLNGATGILTRPRDADSLAEAIGVLATRPADRLAMGEAGRQRTLERFSRKEFSSRVQGVVHKLARPTGDGVLNRHGRS
jgi:glycosyltransferase involved in cell wall biosynthesis